MIPPSAPTVKDVSRGDAVILLESNLLVAMK